MRRYFIGVALFALIAAESASAQQASLQYARPNDETGINVFETTKSDTTSFSGLGVRNRREFCRRIFSRSQIETTPRR